MILFQIKPNKAILEVPRTVPNNRQAPIRRQLPQETEKNVAIKKVSLVMHEVTPEDFRSSLPGAIFSPKPRSMDLPRVRKTEIDCSSLHGLKLKMKLLNISSLEQNHKAFFNPTTLLDNNVKFNSNNNRIN